MGIRIQPPDIDVPEENPVICMLREHSKLLYDASTTLPSMLEKQMKPIADITAGINNMILGEQSSLFANAFPPPNSFLVEQIKPLANITAGMTSGLAEMASKSIDVSALAGASLRMSSGFEEFKDLHAGISYAMPNVLDERRKRISEILASNWILTDNPSQTRSVEVTDSYEQTFDLLEQSDTESLEIDLERILQISPRLKMRLPAMNQALEAHRNRNFLVSIPCLLSQFEGILADYLVSEDLLTVEGYKVYKKQHDPMSSKRIEVHGLKRVANLIENSDLSKIHFLAAYVKEILGDDRNAILHGRKFDYGSADFSTWLVRCIYTLACNICSNEAWSKLENITKLRKYIKH